MLPKLLARLPGQPVAIPDPLWESQFATLPFLQRLDDGERARLRSLAGELLADKAMTGAGGLALEAGMQVNIALQACLPILHLGYAWYRGWSGIVIYPAAFTVERRHHDEDGVVHEYEETIAGESWHGGPVVLSWEDSAPGASGGNVVIHEFAHKLDLLDGEADGVPPFDRRLHPGLNPASWRATLEDAYERLCAELDLVEDELPAHLDPESPEADPFYERLPLDPYAATDPAEFFAVSSEAFFVDDSRLRAAFPDWHGLLTRFYLGRR